MHFHCFRRLARNFSWASQDGTQPVLRPVDARAIFCRLSKAGLRRSSQHSHKRDIRFSSNDVNCDGRTSIAVSAGPASQSRPIISTTNQTNELSDLFELLNSDGAFESLKCSYVP
jgi:hypothetical protein